MTIEESNHHDNVGSWLPSKIQLTGFDVANIGTGSVPFVLSCVDIAEVQRSRWDAERKSTRFFDTNVKTENAHVCVSLGGWMYSTCVHTRKLVLSYYKSFPYSVRHPSACPPQRSNKQTKMRREETKRVVYPYSRGD